MRISLITVLAALAVAASGVHAAEINSAPYGATSDGKKVRALTLTNDSGASVTILDYGATIAAIKVPDRNGVLGNVVLSFADMAGWEALGHANAIIGRVANRITGGFTLDGVHYPLTQNAEGVTSHSGPNPYSRRVWSIDNVSVSDRASVTLSLDSRDGDQGFPGHVMLRATYTFDNRNVLWLDLVATTDRATPINLTNHIYFNLRGNGTAPVYDHLLQIAADRTAVMEPGTSPTGEIVPVEGTAFDFRRPTRLRDRLALALGPEYDNASTAPPIPPGMVRSFSRPFVLPEEGDRPSRVAARLYDPVSGRTIELRTTETTVHLYTPAMIKGGHLSDSGKPFTRVPAVALETQHLPDSPNRPEFPSIIVRPGEIYRSSTVFEFKTN